MDRIYRTGLVFLMLVLFSCGSGTAQKSISLDPEDFERKQMQKADAILLDVRTTEEFWERHLKGAVNIDIRSSVDDDGEDVLKSFLYGFFLNIAQKQPDGSYRSLRWNIPLHIHPSSVLYTILPDYVMYFDVIFL